jgi:hypothetical protein
MNAFLQIIWMILKISLFGVALLATFGGGICGVIFTFSGGFGGSSGIAWGIGMIVLAIISGFVARAIAKSFKNKVPSRPPTNQPPPDDGSGWNKSE